MMGGMPQGGAPMDPSMMGGMMPQEDPVAMIMQQFQEMAAARLAIAEQFKVVQASKQLY